MHETEEFDPRNVALMKLVNFAAEEGAPTIVQSWLVILARRAQDKAQLMRLAEMQETVSEPVNG